MPPKADPMLLVWAGLGLALAAAILANALML